jgi:hypothetical protein
MSQQINPFQFEAATSLPHDQLIEYFIEDNNFSRFVRSNRNIFLVGERGSGKTMNLLYHSIEIQKILAIKKNEVMDFSYIGVYIPCSTPLYQKNEYQLLEDKYLPMITSENLFILDMAYYIIKSIDIIKEFVIIDNIDDIINEIVYVLGININDKNNLYGSLMQYFKKESINCQKNLMTNFDVKTTPSWSFYSLIIPLLGILRKINTLKYSHFMLMIDDVQFLNEYQRKLLNGLISYRDNSIFSCKVATPKINRDDMTTSTGGTILEGHDFLEIDMMQPFQNRNVAFYKFAKEIIERRLEKINNRKIDAENFFPKNPQFERDIEESNRKVKQEALNEHPDWSTKQLNDYVYKFGRAQYFRDRLIKANNPPYSGFEILIHLSTGVIRNLLNPCYWMYDRILSEKQKNNIIEFIPPKIQTEVINDCSKKLWELLNDGLECKVHDCTKVQSDAIKNLYKELNKLFRHRLLNHKSEPRAVVFTISGIDHESEKILLPLLDIAQKANLLYMRMSRAKDDGFIEPYYTPNRMLWPSVGLDPQGQHARVSLKAKDIIAATQGIDFPVDNPIDSDSIGELFDDEL